MIRPRPQRHWLKCCLPFACLLLQACTTVHLDATPMVRSYQDGNAVQTEVAGVQPDHLRVLTLNIAHGRGDSFHQLLQRSDTTRANLADIASLLRDSDAHVAALQEADGPSFWSGNFSHVDYLADHGAFSHSVHGAHASGLGLSYGTALLARLGLSNPRVITFDPERSPIPKGFVVSTISWPGRPDVEVDIVSLHLDFASAATRRQQASELVDVIKARQRPVIVTGDFNNDWTEDSAVRHICQALGLSAYRPDEAGLETFPALDERLDWILVSAGITFRSYRVLPHAVSDHRGVIAELSLAPSPTIRLTRAD